ncbi:MAG: hypothetical protein J0I06_08540 [Planctomycetes bacterium]|nr:hypothetical protein [Planctomycetota bacterium]
MQARINRLLVAAIAVAGFLTLSPRASAELLTLQLDSTVTGTMTVTLGTKTDNVTPGPFHWTDVNDPTNPNFQAPISTFCIELNGQTPHVGDQYTFSVLPLDDPHTTIGTTDKADAIKSLFGNFYNSAWSNPSFTGDTDSKAFQLALWELIYETDPTKTLGSGNFSSTSSAAARADQMLAGLAGGLTAYNNGGYEVVALVAPSLDPLKSTPGQDQIAVRPKGVPAPPGVMLAGIGVLALLGRARWTRRPQAAA